jgi:hypothetical protein
MSDKEFLKKFISSFEIEKGRYSCLFIALTDARKITGRNLMSGKLENNFLCNDQVALDPYSFIGLINYLLILDMLGNIFCEKKKNSVALIEILKKYRTIKGKKLNDSEISTIYALRNSLAHNYSLINIPKDKKYESQKFTIINNVLKDDLGIILPKKIWKSFSDKADESSTTIYYQNVCEIVEDILIQILKDVESGQLNNQLSYGIDELKARFTILTA